jgi:branched-subunit amino acid ABC-type transport system permease component
VTPRTALMVAAITGCLAAVAGILLAMIIGLFRPAPAQDPYVQAYLRWETCTLNDQPQCGPMPQP